MTAKDTRERILETAERLFAETGFEGASVRAITSEAQVNLAALHYHFGSKDQLIEAVFERRLNPLNQERLHRLSELEAQYGLQPVPVDQLCRAFVGPPLGLVQDPDAGGIVFTRLMARAYTQPGDFFERLVAKQFSEVFKRFHAAFSNSLSDLECLELCWRMHFMIGAMAHTLGHALYMLNRPATDEPSKLMDLGNPSPKEIENLLLAFLSGGLQAKSKDAEEGLT